MTEQDEWTATLETAPSARLSRRVIHGDASVFAAHMRNGRMDVGT